jgi:transposase, IS5 family
MASTSTRKSGRARPATTTVVTAGRTGSSLRRISPSSVKSSAWADKRAVRKNLRWEIAAKRGKMQAMKQGRAKCAVKKIEKCKASIPARVEHPFRGIKRQFGLMKVRFRGLTKNTAHVITLFALSNLWMARRKLLAMTEVLRPQFAK